MDNQNNSTTISYKWNWIFSISLMFIGLLTLISSLVWGLLFIVIGIILLPSITRRIKNKFGYSLVIKFPESNKEVGVTKSLCPHCRESVDSKATKCPHCQSKIHRKTSVTKIILVLFIFGIIGMLFSVGSDNKSNSSNNNTAKVPTQEELNYKRKIESTVFAKNVIEKLLKSPSTAKFVDVKAYELSNLKDVWAVNGYVDSQNSYGAMLRSIWEVQLDYRDGKGGTVKSILFDGEKVL